MITPYVLIIRHAMINLYEALRAVLDFLAEIGLTV